MNLLKNLIETNGNIKLFLILLYCSLSLISLNPAYSFQVNENDFILQKIELTGNNKVSLLHCKKFFIIAEDSSKTPNANSSATSEQDEDSSVENSDELNELDKLNIKTNIYKSNDPSFELIDDDTKFDSNAETDILRKEDLIEMSKPHMNKIVKRYKNENVNIPVNNKSYMILPWLVSLVLILLLSIIFKVLLQKKI